MEIREIAGAYSAAMQRVKPEASGETDGFLDVLRSTAANRAGGTAQTAGTAEAENASLEAMLRTKYPNLAYNVGDGSSSYWRTRNDYPFELLFQQSEGAAQRLESWKPAGHNPQYQRHLAVAPCSKAVMIHPKAQARMEDDPAFAKEVFERIEAWWAYDIARNEAICPGYTEGMSHAIAIGADGEITNCLSTGGNDTMQRGLRPGRADKYDWWEERMARHALFMQLWIEGRIDFSLWMQLLAARRGGSGVSGGTGYAAIDAWGAANAEAQIRAMIQGGLREKLGDTIAGTPTEAVIENTWADISRGRSLRASFSML